MRGNRFFRASLPDEEEDDEEEEEDELDVDEESKLDEEDEDEEDEDLRLTGSVRIGGRAIRLGHREIIPS